MAIPESLRQTVRDRANNCCEYCRLPEAAGTLPFHIDHIVPIKHGGTDESDNLCLACFKCNAHKSHDLAGFDPETGELSRLYHPREQRWQDHFILRDDMFILGLTPIGRTTAQVLQMNDRDRMENRQVLAEIGEYPCDSPS